MNVKQKVIIKYNKRIQIFLESSFVEVNRLCVLVYTNQGPALKLKDIILPKRIIDNYVTINGKYFFDQAIFFLSGFSFTDFGNSQDSRGREGTIFYSILLLPPSHEYSDIYLQLCT